MIGAVDSILSQHQIVVRERLKDSARKAYASYPNTTVPEDAYSKTPEYVNFNRNMVRYYSEGANNPTVAKMILVDEINKSAEKTGYKSSLDEVERLHADIDRTRKTLPPFENMSVRVSSLPLMQDALALRCEKQRHEQAVFTKMEDRLAYETKLFRQNFDRANYLLYPKTHRIREMLITCGRFPMDSVKPKMTPQEKQKMFGEFATMTKKFSRVV